MTTENLNICQPPDLADWQSHGASSVHEAVEAEAYETFTVVFLFVKIKLHSPLPGILFFFLKINTFMANNAFVECINIYYTWEFSVKSIAANVIKIWLILINVKTTIQGSPQPLFLPWPIMVWVRRGLAYWFFHEDKF